MRAAADRTRGAAARAQPPAKDLRSRRPEGPGAGPRSQKARPGPAPAPAPSEQPPAPGPGPAQDPSQGEQAASDPSIGHQPPVKPAYVVPVEPAALERSAAHFSHRAGAYVALSELKGEGEEDDAAQIARRAAKAAETREERAGGGGGGGEPLRLRNGLTFVDRGSQTGHWPPKERSTAPEQSAAEDAGGSCSAWEIYDAYAAAAAAGGGEQQRGGGGAAGASREREYTHVTRVVQRMLFQNLNPDLAADFKYWEDPSDAARPEEGTLLPLWQFGAPAGADGRAVTALAWSGRHPDLFAVGYGSFDPATPLTGAIACFSLGDAAQAEGWAPLGAGALAVAFHPAAPALLAVGCSDGSVHVVDLADVARPAVRASSPVASRHGEAVWEVGWVAAPPGRPPRFRAVSSDGWLVAWELAAGPELRRVEEIVLPAGGADAAAAVSSLDAHPAQPSLVLAGTQDGHVLRYCLDLGPETGPEERFSGHDAPAYSVRWSPLHPTAFLTASADWTVRVWDAAAPGGGALLALDAGAAVGDAAWSPAAATVLAAATESGRVLVYDLAHSMDWPLCRQKVVQRGKLTKLAFSPAHPLLLVGDDKGTVSCFKLSPNLRRPPAPTPPGAGRQGGAGEAPARGADAQQKEHLGKILAVAAACRAAEAAWVHVPRPT